MTQTAKENLVLACYHNNIAKNLFAAAAESSQFGLKNRLCANARRCLLNENDMLAICTDEPARQHFRSEIKKGDTLVFANVIQEMLRMNEEQREVVERLIEAIRKGEIVEFVNQ